MRRVFSSPQEWTTIETVEVYQSPFINVRVSPEQNKDTVFDSPCSFVLSDNTLRIFSSDQKINFSVGVGSPKNVVLQLIRAGDELKRSNSSVDAPDWREFTFGDLAVPARMTIEAFCDSKDPFEVTLTIDGNDETSRFWIAMDQSELEQIISVFKPIYC